jgi:hypothetical protein
VDDTELARAVLNAWQIHEYHPDELRELHVTYDDENSDEKKRRGGGNGEKLLPKRVKSARVLIYLCFVCAPTKTSFLASRVKQQKKSLFSLF